MKPLVYLAGPVSGLTFQQACGWRDVFQEALQPDIDVLNPLRGFQHLAGESKLGDGYTSSPFTTDHAIFHGDFFDVQRSDLILVNFLGAQKVSQGTNYEVAWAYSMRKPIVAIIEEKGNVHDHLFLRGCATYRVTTFPDAFTAIRRTLGA